LRTRRTGARPLHHSLCGERSPSRHRCRDGGGVTAPPASRA
jgi:hypothetical protein